MTLIILTHILALLLGAALGLGIAALSLMSAGQAEDEDAR